MRTRTRRTTHHGSFSLALIGLLIGLPKTIGCWAVRVYCLVVLQVCFLVMGNIFCTQLPIQLRYDLKGCSRGRTAGVQAAKVGTHVGSLLQPVTAACAVAHVGISGVVVAGASAVDRISHACVLYNFPIEV
jgi:hypothetical protein